jgi:hypothetical protein
MPYQPSRNERATAQRFFGGDPPEEFWADYQHLARIWQKGGRPGPLPEECWLMLAAKFIPRKVQDLRPPLPNPHAREPVSAEAPTEAPAPPPQRAPPKKATKKKAHAKQVA